METRLGPLHFGVEPLEGTQAVVARSEWLRDEEFSWEGRPLAVREGRSARVFFSVRYTPEILAEKFAAEELHVGRFFATPCGQEGVWHLEARGGGTE
jgi:hypothetical protein